MKTEMQNPGDCEKKGDTYPEVRVPVDGSITADGGAASSAAPAFLSGTLIR